MHVYRSDIPVSSSDCTICTPVPSLILSRENSAFAHFAGAIANHYNLAFSFHQVAVTVG